MIGLARVLMLFAAVCMAAECASMRMREGREGFVSLAEAVPDGCVVGLRKP